MSMSTVLPPPPASCLPARRCFSAHPHSFCLACRCVSNRGSPCDYFPTPTGTFSCRYYSVYVLTPYVPARARALDYHVSVQACGFSLQGSLIATLVVVVSTPLSLSLSRARERSRDVAIIQSELLPSSPFSSEVGASLGDGRKQRSSFAVDMTRARRVDSRSFLRSFVSKNAA